MKHYIITIQKAYGEYIVLGNDEKNGSIVTSGKTLEEAIDMLADAMMCLENVKVGWWNKLLNRLRRY